MSIAEQRQKHLDRANEVRVAVSRLKRGLKDGAIDPATVIAGNAPVWEPVVRRMRLETVLVCVPGIGRVSMRELCAELELPETKRLEDLTFERRRQVANLAAAVVADDTAPPVR